MTMIMELVVVQANEHSQLTAAQYLGQSHTHSPTHVDASVSVRVHNVCISNRVHFRDSKDDGDDGNGIE
jgi:hypothetical protein